MKKLMLVFLVVLTSCTLTKRRYMHGYSVEWNSHKPAAKQPPFLRRLPVPAFSIPKPVNSSTILSKPSTITPNTRKSTIINKFSQSNQPKRENAGVPVSSQTILNVQQYPANYGGHPQNNDEPKASGLAISAMIIGIMALFSFIYVIILGPLAIVLGAIALHKINKNPKLYKGEGFAIAGIILGAVAIFFWIIILFLFVLLISSI